MIDRGDLHIQVESECDGHSIQVLNTDGDRVFFSKYWDHNDDEQGVGVKGTS